MLPIGVIVKMLMSDGLGDKVIQLLIALFVVVIVCFAWWTTSITEQPHYRTVFLLERRLRRRTSRTRLTTHIQSTSFGGTQAAEANVTAGDTQPASVQNSEANKPPEASTSTNTRREGGGSGQIDTPQNIEDEELETIVQIMDADANVVRLRRLAYYENQQGGGTSSANQATTSTDSTVQAANSPEPSNSTNSHVPEEQANVLHDEQIMEHNYAETEALHLNSVDNQESTTSNAKENNDSNIRIKLKYLNDELKLVDGRLEEQLGDFKRRHFQFEFSSNKLVRLIFNGQVLQPDTETLQSCGLFDNCVVHCLVHQQRNAFNDAGSGGSGFTAGTSSSRVGSTGVSQGNNNNNQGRDWDLGNVLFAFVSIILGSAWYFRYEYAHLYTVTATVALVAITGIFTVFLVGVYFPDPQPPQPRVERHSIPT